MDGAIVNESFCNLCALVLWQMLRGYTVLTSSNKSETAVHCCDPALSRVFVMLVSRNVFYVVSALQSIVFTHCFLADQVSCRSYFGSAYCMRSLAVI